MMQRVHPVVRKYKQTEPYIQQADIDQRAPAKHLTKHFQS